MTKQEKLSTKEEIWKLQKKHCYWCGCKISFNEATIDHFYPTSKIPNDPKKDSTMNYKVACEACNKAKGNAWFADEHECRLYVLRQRQIPWNEDFWLED